MSEDPLEHFFKKADDVKLDQKKKDDIHQEVLEFIKKHPVEKKKPKKKWFGIDVSHINRFRLVASIMFAVAAIVVVGGIANTKAEYAFFQTHFLVANSQKKPAVQSSLSYASALKLYEGRRIQFSVDGANYCSMIPANALFKKGTAVMLDNRDEKQLTVAIDNKTYYLKGYGFTIITLTTPAALPHTLSVDCGTGKNNGSIILEK